MYRLSNRLSIVTEYDHIGGTLNNRNWLGYGLKLISRKTSVDFGFLNNMQIFRVIIIGIPFISFTIKY